MNIVKVLGISHLLRMKKAHDMALKHVRGYIFSNCICSLSKLGVLVDMLKNDTINVRTYARDHNLDKEILIYIFEYLYSVKFLDRQGDDYKLSKYGFFISSYANGPFSFIIAYESLFKNLGDLIQQKKRYGIEVLKDKTWVARASAETEDWVPYPVIKTLIKQYRFKSLIDLGCGSAEFLIKLCKDNKDLTGYGVDISSDALKYANERLQKERLGDRIKLIQGDLYNADGLASKITKKIDAITSMYVFHEFVSRGAGGITGILNILKGLKQNFPNTYFIVCELCKNTPDQMRKKQNMISEHHLFHALSNQVLLDEKEWRGLFKKVPFNICEEIKFSAASQVYFVLK